MTEQDFINRYGGTSTLSRFATFRLMRDIKRRVRAGESVSIHDFAMLRRTRDPHGNRAKVAEWVRES